MPPDTGSTCRQHLAFMQWADELMLGAVAENAPARIETLTHIYLGEVVWLERVKGRPDAMLSQLTAPPDLAGLRAAWRETHRDWLTWAGGVVDWTVPVPHRNQAGAHFVMPTWQIVLHLVNHGSFHRGQVAAMLRASGVAPPATDLILYYRQISA